MEEKVDKERFEWLLGGIDWDKLSDRQMRLIESFESYIKKHGKLTYGQSEVMESIYRERPMEHGSFQTSEERRENRRLDDMRR
jgi:hypothetical protein